MLRVAIPMIWRRVDRRSASIRSLFVERNDSSSASVQPKNPERLEWKRQEEEEEEEEEEVGSEESEWKAQKHEQKRHLTEGRAEEEDGTGVFVSSVKYELGQRR